MIYTPTLWAEFPCFDRSQVRSENRRNHLSLAYGQTSRTSANPQQNHSVTVIFNFIWPNKNQTMLVGNGFYF